MPISNNKPSHNKPRFITGSQNLTTEILFDEMRHQITDKLINPGQI